MLALFICSKEPKYLKRSFFLTLPTPENSSIDDLKEDVDNYDDELYDELVDNVTQQYAKQLNTFEKETFIDVNNTGGKY